MLGLHLHESQLASIYQASYLYKYVDTQPFHHLISCLQKILIYAKKMCCCKQLLIFSALVSIANIMVRMISS